ncbi:unnamed protein product [Sphagnum balticum]
MRQGRQSVLYLSKAKFWRGEINPAFCQLNADSIGIVSQPLLNSANTGLAMHPFDKQRSDDFAVSFISPVNALYGNLLAAWPNEATPEESLILLSRDIETQLRRYAQENKVEYFGLSIATDGDTPSTIPYSWLYD